MKAFISGFGTVGQGVLELMVMKEDILKRYGGAKVTGVMDSKSYIVNNDGVCALSVLGNKKNTGKCGNKDRAGKEGKDILDLTDYDVLIECTPTNIDDGGG